MGSIKKYLNTLINRLETNNILPSEVALVLTVTQDRQLMQELGQSLNHTANNGEFNGWKIIVGRHL